MTQLLNELNLKRQDENWLISVLYLCIKTFIEINSIRNKLIQINVSIFILAKNSNLKMVKNILPIFMFEYIMSTHLQKQFRLAFKIFKVQKSAFDFLNIRSP